MRIDYLDLKEYADVPILTMEANRNGGLPVFIRKYSLNDSAKKRLHRHEYMQINYIVKGKGTHFINGQNFEIIKGDIFVIPPFIPHCISNDEGGSIEVFEFEFVPEFINQSFDDIRNAESFLDFAYIEPFLVSESMVSPRLNLHSSVQAEVENVLNEIVQEYTQQGASFLLLIKALTLKLLVILGREFTKSLDGTEEDVLFQRHRTAILKAMDYISRNFDKPISVEEAAKVALLSPSYFCYLFKSITSKTFVEYLNGIRISKAMELLKSTDKKVLEIAGEVGFNNVNHFNRIFRQLAGSTPLQYKKIR